MITEKNTFTLLVSIQVFFEVHQENWTSRSLYWSSMRKRKIHLSIYKILKKVPLTALDNREVSVRMNSKWKKSSKRNEWFSAENTSGFVLVVALFSISTICLRRWRTKFHNTRLLRIIRKEPNVHNFREEKRLNNYTIKWQLKTGVERWWCTQKMLCILRTGFLWLKAHEKWKKKELNWRNSKEKNKVKCIVMLWLKCIIHWCLE